MTSDEQKLVEDVCKQDVLGHLFIFLLRTGLRRSELMQLKWDDYDDVSQEISIRKSKTKAGIRTIYLLTDVQKIIKNQPRINNYIFNSTREKPLTNTVMKKLYERLRVKTGIMHLTNHVCRHTFVTRLCEKQVSPKAIAQIIRHAKTDYVMDIYALIENKQLKLAIYKLEEGSHGSDVNQCVIKLPPYLYNRVSKYATSNGIVLDTFVTQTMLATIKEEPLPKVINICEIIKKG